MTKRQLFFGALAVIAATGWLFLQSAERHPSIPFASVTQPVIDLPRFERIQIGMTLPQVRSITGTPGKLQSQTEIGGIRGEMYIWQNPGGSNALVQFQDGHVVTKAQALLR